MLLRDVDSPQQKPTSMGSLANPLDDRAKNMEWIGKAAKWLPMKAVPAIGKGIGEAASDFYNLFNTVEDPTLGIDPVTQQPRKNFGAVLVARQLFPMLKTDFDAFWDKDRLQVVRDMMAARAVYGEDSPAFAAASKKLAAQNREWAQSSFSMAMMSDYLTRYGSWEKFGETIYDRPDKILMDLADFGAFKAFSPHLASILRKATPDNVYSVIDEAQLYIKGLDPNKQGAYSPRKDPRLNDLAPEMYDYIGNAGNTEIKVLYHGSPKGEEIEGLGYFDIENLGDRTGAHSAQKGFFFTDDDTVADSYAQRSISELGTERQDLEQLDYDIENFEWELKDKVDITDTHEPRFKAKYTGNTQIDEILDIEAYDKNEAFDVAHDKISEALWEKYKSYPPDTDEAILDALEAEIDEFDDMGRSADLELDQTSPSTYSAEIDLEFQSGDSIKEVVEGIEAIDEEEALEQASEMLANKLGDRYNERSQALDKRAEALDAGSSVIDVHLIIKNPRSGKGLRNGIYFW